MKEKKTVEKCKGCHLKKYAKEEEKKFKDVKVFEIIHEDDGKDGFIINYALNPEVDGHLVVQPKFHADQLYDLCEDQASRLIRTIRASCKALQKYNKPERIYIYSFNETKGFHFHVHIKPRTADVPVKGPCFVNWKDPKIEKRVQAIEEEKNKNRKQELESRFRAYHKQIAERIRKNEFIEKLSRR